MLTEKQREALELLETGKNVFLTGNAGTGKSFLLKQFIKLHPEKKFVKCAPTGIAALNIGGTTIHRLFKIKQSLALNPGMFSHEKNDVLDKADVLIIDEISMCRLDLFEYIMLTLVENYKKTPKQVVVVGDFFQLPPIIEDKEKMFLNECWGSDYFRQGYAFQSKMWEQMKFVGINLTEIVRQSNQDFINELNLIRSGRINAVNWFNENASKEPIPNAIYLCGRNAMADEINRNKADEIVSPEKCYSAETEGIVTAEDKPTEDNLKLKVGMQVMTLVNRNGYKNGSIGKIMSLNDENIEVQLNNGRTVLVERFSWEINDYKVTDGQIVKEAIGKFTQFPLKIAYAITIHKSQGQTYDAANIYPDCFENGQLYVALSRVTDIERLHLAKKIHPFDVRTTEAVKFFYKRMEKDNVIFY